MKANRAAFGRRLRGDEAAVSDVLGSILLVGITVVTAAALATLLFSFQGPSNTQHSLIAVTLEPTNLANGTTTWGGNGSIVLTHLGGEPLPQSLTTVSYTVNGVPKPTLTGTALGFPGKTLNVGERWTKDIGVISLQDSVFVQILVASSGGQLSVLSANTVIAAPLSNVIGLQNLTRTYVATQQTVLGSVSTFANAQSAADNASEAVWTEGALASSPTATTLLCNSANTTGSTALLPANACADDNLLATESAAGTNLLNVSGFVAPAGSIGVSSIVLVINASRAGSTTDTLSYQLNGVSTGSTSAPALTTSEAQYSLNVTADRAWAISDIGNLSVRMTRNSGTVNIDWVGVQLTYTFSQYTLNATLNWTGVPQPASAAQVLELGYRVDVPGDVFTATILTNSTSRLCGGTLSLGAPSLFSCSLLSSEIVSGVVRVRLNDLTPTGTTQGVLRIDYARVSTTS